jgi:shikimate dehydrogenase
VSRSSKENFITYDELYNISDTIDVIINTTPVGMYPNIFETAVEIERFKNLSGVVDAVYNPLRSKLVLDALKRNIKAVGGLYMLVAQAVIAYGHFFGVTPDPSLTDRVYGEILREKENIVLIGMPASGKSTVGKLLSEKLSRELIDSDTVIVENAAMPIPEIFDKFGEEHFRQLEAEAIAEISKRTGAVIATGGGAVLRAENLMKLSQNGRIYFIDRPLDKLIPTEDRPTASSVELIKKRYEERYPLYKKYADVCINANGPKFSITNKILLKQYGG